MNLGSTQATVHLTARCFPGWVQVSVMNLTSEDLPSVQLLLIGDTHITILSSPMVRSVPRCEKITVEFAYTAARSGVITCVAITTNPFQPQTLTLSIDSLSPTKLTAYETWKGFIQNAPSISVTLPSPLLGVTLHTALELFLGTRCHPLVQPSYLASHHWVAFAPLLVVKATGQIIEIYTYASIQVDAFLSTLHRLSPSASDLMGVVYQLGQHSILLKDMIEIDWSPAAILTEIITIHQMIRPLALNLDFTEVYAQIEALASDSTLSLSAKRTLETFLHHLDRQLRTLFSSTQEVMSCI